jgi:hypothetical protein
VRRFTRIQQSRYCGYQPLFRASWIIQDAQSTIGSTYVFTQVPSTEARQALYMVPAAIVPPANEARTGLLVNVFLGRPNKS